MFDGRTTAVWTVAAALLAVTTLSETKWHADPANDWRPCRATAAAAGRRRHDEIVKIDGEQDENDGEADYARGEAAAADNDNGDNDDGEAVSDDDEFVEEEQQPPPPAPRRPVVLVDDQLKRGVRVPSLTAAPNNRPYGKKWDRPPYPAVSGADNGLRMDTSLLRGETVELPTYVNVPVTLRCKFVPLDGTDNKFETVVEAMYPGHADAPLPPPDSHASQILKQLMGSVNGWRSVVNKSTRPVRRVVDNLYGRHHHRYSHNHRGWQTEEQPGPVVEQIVPERDDRRPVDWTVHRSAEEPTQIENQLVEGDQRLVDRVEGDRRLVDRVDEQLLPLMDGVDGEKPFDRVDEQRLVDGVDDGVAEKVDDRRMKGPDDGLPTTMPEITTAVESDYAIFGQNVPVRAVTGNAITTPSV